MEEESCEDPRISHEGMKRQRSAVESPSNLLFSTSDDLSFQEHEVAHNTDNDHQKLEDDSVSSTNDGQTTSMSEYMHSFDHQASVQQQQFALARASEIDALQLYMKSLQQNSSTDSPADPLTPHQQQHLGMAMLPVTSPIVQAPRAGMPVPAMPTSGNLFLPVPPVGISPVVIPQVVLSQQYQYIPSSASNQWPAAFEPNHALLQQFLQQTATLSGMLMSPGLTYQPQPASADLVRPGIAVAPAGNDVVASQNEADHASSLQISARRAYNHESFPEKLYRMLEEVELAGKDDIVSFTADGRAFEIHRPDAFEEELIPHYFRHKNMASFRRQLSMYGFKKIKDGGPAHGGYAHTMFVKGNPTQCKQMKRPVEDELSSSATARDDKR